jgi:acyl-CoA reductase-like NAD-dependent aldehyde dehydrogenase
MNQPIPDTFDPKAVAGVLHVLAEGAENWRKTALHKRVQRVRELRRLIARRADDIAARIAAATDRPVYEVLTQEVLPVLEMSRYCERHSPGWLRTRYSWYLRPGFLRSRQRLYWEPYGAIAVLTPCNFPFSLAVMTTTFLTLAGNTVILKPSERVPEVSTLIAELLTDAELAPAVAGVVEGGPDAGRYLAAAEDVAKVVFFGRRQAGQELAEVCTGRGIPFLLELGGGSSSVVLADADLDRAAAGIAWSAFYAHGCSCVGTDRVFLEAAVEDVFLDRLACEAQCVWRQSSLQFTLSASTGVLIRNALEAGAQWLATPEGAGAGSSGIAPGILTGVQPGSAILRHELFAPVLAVCTVASGEEAVRQANRGCPMLGASVWTRDRHRARALARQLKVGMIWVNDSSFGLPNLPWGGWGRAGWGTLFSQYAVHEAARLKWVSENPASGRRLWWHPYTSAKLRAAQALTRLYRR